MDDDEKPQVFHKATLNSEFLRHPQSGAFFRNPLRQRSTAVPTMLSDEEFSHNCLDQVLRDCPTITISENALRKLLGDDDSCSATSTSASSGRSSALSTPRSTPNSARSLQRRVPLNRLPEVPVGCEIFVSLPLAGSERHHHFRRNSDAQEKKEPKPFRKDLRAERRAERQFAEVQAHKTQPNKDMLVENLNVDMSVDSTLQVARIREGPLARWNRMHPDIQVRVGDHIVKVNGQQKGVSDMLADLVSTTGVVSFVVRRPSRPTTPRGRNSATPSLPAPARS